MASSFKEACKLFAELGVVYTGPYVEEDCKSVCSKIINCVGDKTVYTVTIYRGNDAYNFATSLRLTNKKYENTIQVDKVIIKEETQVILVLREYLGIPNLNDLFAKAEPTIPVLSHIYSNLIDVGAQANEDNLFVPNLHTGKTHISGGGHKVHVDITEGTIKGTEAALTTNGAEKQARLQKLVAERRGYVHQLKINPFQTNQHKANIKRVEARILALPKSKSIEQRQGIILGRDILSKLQCYELEHEEFLQNHMGDQDIYNKFYQKFKAHVELSKDQIIGGGNSSEKEAFDMMFAQGLLLCVGILAYSETFQDKLLEIEEDDKSFIDNFLAWVYGIAVVYLFESVPSLVLVDENIGENIANITRKAKDLYMTESVFLSLCAPHAATNNKAPLLYLVEKLDPELMKVIEIVGRAPEVLPNFEAIRSFLVLESKGTDIISWCLINSKGPCKYICLLPILHHFFVRQKLACDQFFANFRTQTLSEFEASLSGDVHKLYLSSPLYKSMISSLLKGSVPNKK